MPAPLREKNKTLRSLTAFGVGLLMTLFILELALRGVDQFVLKPSEAVSEIPAELPPGHIRILVIGESTTTKIGIPQPETSWPSVLEKTFNTHLESSGASERIAIFNIARAATTSPFLVSEVERGFSDFNADVIISMMGINDAAVFARERGFFYRNFSLVRFLFWASVAWKCPSCYRVDLSESEGIRKNKYTKLESFARRHTQEACDAALAAPNFASADLNNFKLSVDAIHRNFPNESHAIDNAFASCLFSLGRKQRDKKLAAEILELSNERSSKSYSALVTIDETAIEMLCNIRIAQGLSCFEELKAVIKLGAPIRPPLLTAMLARREVPDEEIEKIFEQFGFSFDPTRSRYHSTREAYRKLLRIVEESGALWYAMQYPTGETNGLKGFFSDSYGAEFKSFASSFYSAKPVDDINPEFKNGMKQLKFISNRNFVDIVDTQNELEYFVDFFGRDQGLNFGHATPKGDALIAKNAFEALKADWPEIVARAKSRRATGGSRGQSR